ncbi:hypothetical protein ABB02_01078 [Clostridiaceae bacterium JG1575]|nr:hypothetical protein ABB02_01078 [Clostridiaceae bacterium JG1575]
MAESTPAKEGISINTRKNRLTLGALVLLFFGTALFYQYGWRYTGYKMVTEPNYLIVEEVQEKGRDIVIDGVTALNIGSYVGSILTYEDGVLYIGVRYSLFGDDTHFHIVYPQTKGVVDRVVLQKKDTEKTIWIRPWKERAKK